MTGSPAAPASDDSSAQPGRTAGAVGGGNPSAGTPGPAAAAASIEQRLLHALRSAEAALAAGQLQEAAQLMQATSRLFEAALRDPSALSRSGLAEIRRLFTACLETGRPLQDQLVKRMAESVAPGKAARAYRSRR